MQHHQKRYVAYYRVSTQKQGQTGLGMEAQKQAVSEFLAAFGGEILAEFTEVESGTLTLLQRVGISDQPLLVDSEKDR